MAGDDWRNYPITSGLLAEIFDAYSGADGFNLVVSKVRERQAALAGLAEAIGDVGSATARMRENLQPAPMTALEFGRQTLRMFSAKPKTSGENRMLKSIVLMLVVGAVLVLMLTSLKFN